MSNEKIKILICIIWMLLAILWIIRAGFQLAALGIAAAAVHPILLIGAWGIILGMWFGNLVNGWWKD